MHNFQNEAPSRIRVYPCPACHETISVDAASCRFCHVPIDAQTASRLLAENRRVTTAIAYANTYSVSTRLAALIIAFALYKLIVDRALYASWLILPFIGMGYGALWLWRSRALVTHDPDYPAAIKKVKFTMIAWLGMLLVQLAAYAALIWLW